MQPKPHTPRTSSPRPAPPRTWRSRRRRGLLPLRLLCCLLRLLCALCRAERRYGRKMAEASGLMEGDRAMQVPVLSILGY